jgi:hypothetical protein
LSIHYNNYIYSEKINGSIHQSWSEDLISS